MECLVEWMFQIAPDFRLGSAKGHGYVSMGTRILGILAQNGSENGSEGCSEAPESIPMVSDRSDFEPGSECHFFQKSELRELKFQDFEGSKNSSETS